MMASEKALEQERGQIVEAMDWIDAERKRLSRFCFSETRKKWHGQRDRGRAITLMKKESEWLYRQRTRIRLERDRAERREKKEKEAAEREAAQPALFDF